MRDHGELNVRRHRTMTYNAFYLRKQAADDAMREAISSLYPKARIEMPPDFIGAVLSRNDIKPPEQSLADLSSKFATDVIWVTCQTTAESFIFHHWRAGEQLRGLWYGCASEGTWERAEGQAEPWEAQEFWSRDALESALECAKSDSERRELEQLWKEQVIRKGQTEPSVSSEDAVAAVMQHYWLYDPNPGGTADVRAGGAAPTPLSTGARVLRLLIWAAILCSIGLLLWRHSK